MQIYKHKIRAADVSKHKEKTNQSQEQIKSVISHVKNGEWEKAAEICAQVKCEDPGWPKAAESVDKGAKVYRTVMNPTVPRYRREVLQGLLEGSKNRIAKMLSKFSMA